MRESLSIAVMMHPDREIFRPYLLERLGDVPVVLDRGRGVWDTCRRAWETATGEFHLVVQDDAILCRDFRRRVEALLLDRCAYSLYFGWRARFEDLARTSLEAGGCVLPQLHWGLAVVMPRELVEPMLAFGDRLPIDDRLDDTRIRRFCQANAIPVRYPLPSLVDHRLTTSLVTGQATACRKAIYFAGE